MTAVLVLTVAAGALSGCGGNEAAGDEEETTLVIRGSDTLVNLSAAWAEAFMEANPGYQVSVSGGGSSTGFAALIEGSVDLANASRSIKDSERQALEDKGTPPVEHVVAMDAVSIVVHTSNPIESLTMAQLADIFTGRVTNWSAVGGEDREITIYSRDSASGTYAFVREHVMDEEDYAPAARLMNSNKAIKEAVAQDPTAIGYIGLGYVDDTVKVLAIAADENSEPVAPSVESAASGAYPVARNLYVYSAGEPSELARKFIDFCTSEAGRAITEEMGFVPPPAGGN